MSRKKKAKPAVKKAGERSEIIEQCVIYVQSIAAHAAGFDVDHTGDSVYAANNRLLKKAKRAMIRLIALSPAYGSKPPLSATELHSKASVLGMMTGLAEGAQPDHIEAAYIRIFARELSDYFGSVNEKDDVNV